MKICDIRIEDVQNDPYGAPAAAAEVEVEIDDGKIHLIRFYLNPHEVMGSMQYNTQGNLNAALMNKTNSQPDPSQFTVDDYMPQIKREVGKVVTNRMFAEWDKMRKLKS